MWNQFGKSPEIALFSKFEDLAETRNYYDCPAFTLELSKISRTKKRITGEEFEDL